VHGCWGAAPRDHILIVAISCSLQHITASLLRITAALPAASTAPYKARIGWART
jgi:hypothetical protein